MRPFRTLTTLAASLLVAAGCTSDARPTARKEDPMPVVEPVKGTIRTATFALG